MDNSRPTLDLWAQRFAVAGLFIVAAGVFVSAGLSALSQPLFILSGLYFLPRSAKDVPKSVWSMLALFVACLLSVPFNLDIIAEPKVPLFKARYYLCGFLTYFALRGCWDGFLGDKVKVRALKTFLFCMDLATLAGLWALASGYNPLRMKAACHAERACGLYGMYMTYGYGIGMACVLLAWAWWERKALERWASPAWIGASLGINLLGLFFSYARGAWMGFVAGMAVLVFLKNRKAFLGAVVAGAVAFGVAVALVTPVRKMFLERSVSNEQRLDFARAAVAAFRERPVFGWGLRNFEPHSSEIKTKYGIGHAREVGHAHNNFLEQLASTGLVGLAALLAWLALWGSDVWRSQGIERAGILAFGAAFVVSGLTQYTFGDSENLFLILPVFALSLQGRPR